MFLSAFSEVLSQNPILRTLLRTLSPSKTYCKAPSKTPLENLLDSSLKVCFLLVAFLAGSEQFRSKVFFLLSKPKEPKCPGPLRDV